MMIPTLLLAATMAALPQGLVRTPVDTACRKMKYRSDPDTMSTRERSKSPLDSVTFTLDGRPVKLCYSRPSARGRTMIGGEAVPYGKFWRTGANEPTYLLTPITLSFGGLPVPRGAYSLYTLPGETEWRVMLNRSLSHWGFTLQQETQAQDLGSTTIRREWTARYIETFTIRPDPGPVDPEAIVLEWERTRIRIPISATGATQSEMIRHCVRRRDWTQEITPPVGLCYDIREPGPKGGTP